MIAAGFVGLLGAGALLAQTATTKTAEPNAAAVAGGKTVFQQKCSVCHYDNSEQGSNGVLPQAGIVANKKGVLFGTTLYGGSGPCTNNLSGCGVVFALTP